jgi:hypothetical protein
MQEGLDQNPEIEKENALVGLEDRRLPQLGKRLTSLLIWNKSGSYVDAVPYAIGVISSCALTYGIFGIYYFQRLAPMPPSAIGLYVFPNALSFAVTAFWGSVISISTVHLAYRLGLRMRPLYILTLALSLSFLITTIIRTVDTSWGLIWMYGNDPLSRTFIRLLKDWFFYFGFTGLSSGAMTLLTSGLVRYSKWYQRLFLKSIEDINAISTGENQSLQNLDFRAIDEDASNATDGHANR